MNICFGEGLVQYHEHGSNLEEEYIIIVRPLWSIVNAVYFNVGVVKGDKLYFPITVDQYVIW